MDFETAYREWLKSHMKRRKGERLRMLKVQHGYAERLMLESVWWPVVGNFEFLHPEYEVKDEDGGYSYLDFAYLRGPQPTDLEVDGFGPHARDADRHSFKRDRRRQNAIALNDWHVLRFSADDIKDDPEYCRRTLRRMLERWYGEDRAVESGLNAHEKEAYRLAVRASDSVTPTEVAKTLQISAKYARGILQELVMKDVLEPASGRSRIRSYRLKERRRK